MLPTGSGFPAVTSGPCGTKLEQGRVVEARQAARLIYLVLPEECPVAGPVALSHETLNLAWLCGMGASSCGD
jgi:hypothetical protein